MNKTERKNTLYTMMYLFYLCGNGDKKLSEILPIDSDITPNELMRVINEQD